MREDNYKVLIYTRKPEVNGYTASLGNSVHLAYSLNQNEFEPLNQNYGILFASATISEQNTIIEKGLKNPYIFRTKEGYFGIIAVRVDKEGNDDFESKGRVLLWTSADLIKFRECGLLKLHDDKFVQTVICEYNEKEKSYEIRWCDRDGNYFKNSFKSLADTKNISAPAAEEAFSLQNCSFNLKGIVPGGIIKVNRALIKEIRDYWTPLHNTEIFAPEDITVSSEEQLRAYKAKAVYSDGSVAYKSVDWDYSSVDFSKPGEHRIQGKVCQETYQFPLAVGYADPVVFKWNGKYYFIATNDNTDDVGLFVREADTVPNLFAPGMKESLILDYNEKRGWIQTFWAPEFHVIGGNLYILFAVGGKMWSPQSHMMKLKKGGNITNPLDWESPLRVKKADGSFLAEDGITLDMTYFNADGGHYLVWSYRKDIGTPLDTGSMLYIASVNENTPWILDSEPVLLSRPLYGWENIQGTINNEGPYPLVTEDKVYIAYSGGSANGYTYAVGTLAISKGKDYLNPHEWEKSTAPLLSYYSIKDEYGPGHNSFYLDENGNVMIAYHAKEAIDQSPRCTAIRRVHFNKNGIPVFNMSVNNDLNENLTNISADITII